jgi:glycosyltransferase involved in cell wall biosynthesis
VARAPLRVLIAHNAYQERGGEDSVVASEHALLTERGHAVELYTRHNDDVAGMSRLALAKSALWSGRTVADLEARVATFRPDVIHVHNTVPLISPAIYWVAKRLGVPVVQTLHNFRLLCPQAMFVREGKVCEDCLGRLPWAGIRHACYRGSRAQTAVVAGTTLLHNWMGTYAHKVDRFIALNEFCRAKFIQGGLPADKVVVKPNFVRVDGQPTYDGREGVLYLGRLTPEKGLPTLLAAAQQSKSLRQQLRVVGAGPMADEVAHALGDAHLGPCAPHEVWGHLQRALCMVVPSVWYEGFPRTIVEAYGAGVPVIASRLGSLAEVVEDGRTGLLFEPGNPQDLADKLSWALSHPERMQEMGRAARALYEHAYAPDVGYEALIQVYRSAMAAA